ncbi:uncharacterized protein LOC135697096 [Ochlerotatus camptorhynchus]|uniref:uncharacterized protein LOC135697096 n=1 Tax=Ochlerotatus camptorhynchus TaxID=644619 RepID=UPI0031D67D49
MRNRYFLTKTGSDKARLRELELEYKVILSATHENYLLSIQSTVKENPSRFWDFIKKRKAGNGIPGSVNFDGTTSRSSSEAANLFATFFESVFSKASPVQRQNCFEKIPSYNINLPCIQFSPDEVQKVLDELDSKKGPGTDSLPPVFLKNWAATLATPIAAVFNRSLQDNYPLSQMHGKWRP